MFAFFSNLEMAYIYEELLSAGKGICMLCNQIPFQQSLGKLKMKDCSASVRSNPCDSAILKNWPREVSVSVSNIKSIWFMSLIKIRNRGDSLDTNTEIIEIATLNNQIRDYV